MRYLVFEHKIIIYWLYEHFLKDAKYRILLNNKEIGSTNKTHFTIDGLESNTSYRITVYQNDKLLFEEDIKTKQQKKILNVLDIDQTIDTTGKELVTKKIQRILDLANKDNIIYFPRGKYLTGALFVHSDTDICLEKDAFIQGSENPDDYLPKIPSRFEGTELPCYASLINIGKSDHNSGYTTKNVTLRGEGTIYGGGHELCEAIIAREMPTSGDRINAGRKRGRLLNISNAQNVVIEGLSIGYGASWTIHPIYSDNVVTTNCHIESKHFPNGDGWDPDSSSNCVCFNCEFDVGDDMFAIKSGKNPEGNIVNIPSHDIYIFDCKSIHSHGAAIGSEISGGVYNIFFWDLDMLTSMHGLHIKASKKRGGYVKNVIFDNCKGSAIFVESNVNYNDDGEAAKSIPTFSDFVFSNIELNGILHDSLDRVCVIPHISLVGYEEDPHLVRNITIDNVVFLNNGLKKEECVYSSNCENIVINNIHYSK